MGGPRKAKKGWAERATSQEGEGDRVKLVVEAERRKKNGKSGQGVGEEEEKEEEAKEEENGKIRREEEKEWTKKRVKERLDDASQNPSIVVRRQRRIRPEKKSAIDRSRGKEQGARASSPAQDSAISAAPS